MIFTNVVKPTHLCNLACKYCYNDDIRNPIMDESTLENVISKTFSYIVNEAQNRRASFIWHGGEPMMAQLEFFEKAVAFQKKYAGAIDFENSIQTNGTLIDDIWIKFFKEHNFTVSISIDGTKDLNDKNRVDHRGHGSYDRVISAIKKVRDAKIPLGICIVISADNKDYIEEIYGLVSSMRIPFNIIPLNKSGRAVESYDELGLEAEEYADAWIKMYDMWFDSDEDYVYCSDFVFKTRAILAGKPVDCIGLKSCASSNISIDPIGNVYPCATLSGNNDSLYGNINDMNLSCLLESPRALSYRYRAVDEQCAFCKWQHICHGGCHVRAYKFYGDHNKRDYYCPSLYKIYEHIEQRLLDIQGVYQTRSY